MGQPTFDLCYSEEWSAGAQSGGLFDVDTNRAAVRWTRMRRRVDARGARSLAIGHETKNISLD
jgi:hypothetical protein